MEMSGLWVSASDEGGERLAYTVCRECGASFLPPVESCARCGSTKVENEAASGTGRLYAFSSLHVSRPEFSPPYLVAYVDLPDGLRVFGQLDASMPLGSEVMVYRGPIARPAGEEPRLGIRFKALENRGERT